MVTVTGALLCLGYFKRRGYKTNDTLLCSGAEKKQKQKLNGTGKGMLFCSMRNWFEYLQL